MNTTTTTNKLSTGTILTVHADGVVTTATFTDNATGLTVSMERVGGAVEFSCSQGDAGYWTGVAEAWPCDFPTGVRRYAANGRAFRKNSKGTAAVTRLFDRAFSALREAAEGDADDEVARVARIRARAAAARAADGMSAQERFIAAAGITDAAAYLDDMVAKYPLK